MFDNISLREFNKSDLEAVQILIYRTIDVCYMAVYPEGAVEFFKNHHSMENILKDAETGHTLVLESEERIVATGTLFETNVRRVFVDPSFQGRNLGKSIMKELESQAQENAVPIVELEASLPSIRFYEILGYNDRGERFISLENNQKLIYRKMTKNLVSVKESI